MSGNSTIPIASRASRLNSLILNRPESLSKEQKEVCSAINREGLLDALFLLYEECNKDALKKRNKNVQEFASKYRPIIRETKKLRVGLADFELKSQIGNGYFGEVNLVTEKSTKDVFAIKTIKKAFVSNCQILEERDIMVLGRKCEWITRLQYAFYDRDNLYLVMEYLPGGDLLGLMIRHGAFDEELARFYLAEIALAINALHCLGFVHRDLKPENILLDRCGHLKLADFGSSVALNEDGSFISLSPAGTPDYVAPELLQILSTKGNQSGQKLDVSCDYWSMGIIGYEMIVEKTPFHSDNVFDTYAVIQNYSDDKRLMQVLEFPNEVRMSKNLKDLLNGLITKKSRRMDFDEITDHPFFDGIIWLSLREQVPPIIPFLSGEDDTSNFDDVDKSSKRCPVLKKSTFTPINMCEFSGDDLPFLGYSYIYEECSKFLKATPKNSSMQLESKMSTKISDLQLTIKEQMKEIKLLQKDVLCAEKKAVQMNSLEKIHSETKEENSSMKDELKAKIMELASCKKEIKTLKSSLKVEEEMRNKSSESAAEVMQQNYEKLEKIRKKSEESLLKQLCDKQGEISGLKERIRAHEIEVEEKASECQHLSSSLEKFKSFLKTTKEQMNADKTDYEDVRKKITENYESKVQDLRSRLNAENKSKSETEKTIKDLRKQLEQVSDSNKSLMDSKEKLDSELTGTRRQLGKEIDENNRLQKEKKELEKMMKEAHQSNDELKKEIFKLQEENIKRQFKLSKTIAQPIQISGSRASNEGEFKSAHGSMTELNVADAEELKMEIARVKENENIQRRRADNLEQVVEKLENVVKKLNATADQTVGGILEKRNEKLEDELTAVREQTIIDRQQTKSTYLQFYKLEKELGDLKHEKNMFNRKMETANEKCSKAIHERESLELKIKQQLDIISTKESSIIDFQRDIRNYKYELKQEREKWSATERDRLAEKTEIIEKTSNIKNLEEKARESTTKIRLLELKVSQLTDEKDILQRRLNDEKSQRAVAEDRINELSDDLEQKIRNYELLKEAAATVEQQLNMFEEMFNKEVHQNTSNATKIDDLRAKLRQRDDENSKLKKELGKEKALNVSAESNKCQLQNELDELKEVMQNAKSRLHELQNQLIKKQEVLYEAQENIEITSSDLHHLQKLKCNYENEIIILKEETSRILTDLYRSKEEAKRLAMELKDSRCDIDELYQEKDHLNTLLSELRAHSKERDVRTEATVSQQKKLIDYLTQRVEELQNKKKRGIAEVLFGANTTNYPPQTPKSVRKENIPPTVPSSENSKLKKAQEDLKREKERNQRLKENLMQTKLEIRKSASMKSPEKTIRESTIETASIAPSAPPEDLVQTITATVHAEPSFKLQNENFQRVSSSNGSPKAHHFAMTIETASPSPNIALTSCLVCDKFILVGQPFWVCKECKLSVHRKCRGMVKSSCQMGDGLTTSSSETTSTSTNDSHSKKIQLDDVDGIKAFDDSSSIGSGSDLLINSYSGDHILCSSRFGLGWVMTSTPKINAVYELTKNVILFGCTSGLYSYHIDDNKIVQIKGMNHVNYFSIKPNLTKSIIIGDSGDNLYECDLRVLMNKSHQSGLLEPKLNIQVIDLSIANRSADEKWHFVELHGNTEHLNDAIAIAATCSRMVILKYDPKIGRFKPVRSLDTVTAISDILFTQHSAIVACDKFFEIDLNSYNAEEFLDMSDLSLRQTKNSTPMSVFRINSCEFLLCFKDYGIFVDDYGLRARKENIYWNHEPKRFFYKNFLLYIIHDNSIQIVRINNSARKHEKESSIDFSQSRTFITMDGEKKFTHNGCTNAYVANILKTSRSENGHTMQDLIQIDAEKVFKMNLNRSMTSLISESNTSLATLSIASSGADTIN